MTTADAATPSRELSSKELLQAFLIRASNNLGPLRDLIQTLFRVTDDNMRQEMLADFFLRFNALAPKAPPRRSIPRFACAPRSKGC